MRVGRRPVLKATAGLAALGGTGYVAARTTRSTETSTTEEWPSFMHTADNTGFNPHASVSTSGVTERWTVGPKDTASDDETNGYGAPIYVDDTLYVGGYERLWALDPSDGSEKWRYDPQQPEPSDADISAIGSADGTVFVGTDHGEVAAVDAADGTEQWHQQVATSDSEGDHHEGRHVRIRGLTAADGYVLAMEDGSTMENAVLHALDASDGTELWQRDEGAQDTQNPREPAAPAIHDGVVYDTADGLVALDAETGEEIWGPRAPRTNDFASYSDGTLYVSGGKNGEAYYAVDAETGETVWKTPFEGGRTVSARQSAVDDERAYAGEFNGDQVGHLIAFDRENGDIVWTNDQFDGGSGAFTVDADAVYVNDHGTLAALNPEDGSVLWTYEGAGLPTLVDSTAYAGGTDLVALGPESTPTPTDSPTDTASPTDSPTETECPCPNGTDTSTTTTGTTETTTTGTTTTSGTGSTDTDTASPMGTTDTAAGSPDQTTGGGPGLGVLATLGGLASVAGYYLYGDETDAEE